MDLTRLAFVVWILALSGCRDTFEYSPYQRFDRDSPVDINAKNIERMLAMSPADDTLTIAFVGDSQRFYDELEWFVNRANQIDELDLVILAGDVSDFGLLEEFELVYERLEQLRVPYITALGNHDVLGRGVSLFERLFGPVNFSFVYHNIKFVVHNTNSMEFPGTPIPDLVWLSQELVPGDHFNHFLLVSHVPPYDFAFSTELETEYAGLLSDTPNLLASLHGHAHDHYDGYPYQDGVRYMTSYAFKQRAFILLKIIHGEVLKAEISY